VPDELALVVVISGVAAIASVVGGMLALWHRSSSLISSLAFGFDLGQLGVVVVAFAVGMLGLFAFDLVVHGGRILGEHADQRRIVRRYHRRRGSGSPVVVLAGGTSAEELVEGLAIGVGAAIEPSLAVIVATAIAIDNLAEGMSVGELIRTETPERAAALPRVLAWTGTIGLALFASAVLGWLLLRDIPPGILSALLAAGAGAMLYLTLSSLVPEGEARQYQGSATLASGVSFAMILVLATLQG